MWFCFKESEMSCENCNYDCDQGRKCSGRVLGGPWYGLIAAVAILDPEESRARSRRAREKSVFVPPAPKPAPDEVEDADDSSAWRAACPT